MKIIVALGCVLSLAGHSLLADIVFGPEDLARVVVLSKQTRDRAAPNERYARLDFYLRTLLEEAGLRELRVQDWKELDSVLRGILHEPCLSEHPEYIARTARCVIELLQVNPVTMRLVDDFGLPPRERYRVLRQLETVCRHIEDEVLRRFGRFPSFCGSREVWDGKWWMLARADFRFRDYLLRQPPEAEVTALMTGFDRKLAQIEQWSEQAVAGMIDDAIRDFTRLTKNRAMMATEEGKTVIQRKEFVATEREALRGMAERLERDIAEPISEKTKALEAAYQKAKNRALATGTGPQP